MATGGNGVDTIVDRKAFARQSRFVSDSYTCTSAAMLYDCQGRRRRSRITDAVGDDTVVVALCCDDECIACLTKGACVVVPLIMSGRPGRHTHR